MDGICEIYFYLPRLPPLPASHPCLPAQPAYIEKVLILVLLLVLVLILYLYVSL
jgi:hypothetical protein